VDVIKLYADALLLKANAHAADGRIDKEAAVYQNASSPTTPSCDAHQLPVDVFSTLCSFMDAFSTHVLAYSLNRILRERLESPAAEVGVWADLCQRCGWKLVVECPEKTSFRAVFSYMTRLHVSSLRSALP
jgi:hypothetical protein